MIGDWISYIPEIAEGEDSYLEEPHNIQVDLSCLQKVDELIFAPIPLTYELLKKNGWKEEELWYEYLDDKATIQSCLPDMRGIINEVEIKEFQCKYVHQYQHLLRLCGLDELADNFKI